MRLLKFDDQGTLSPTDDLQDNIPPYAILSHTWGEDKDEVTFDDLKLDSFQSKRGYAKIRFCGEQARKDGLEYFWVDTCCINKANNIHEYSEAINSMFRWYRDAGKCYVYLSDVSAHNVDANGTKRPWKIDFRKSLWFRRGWTLQELLAPASVEFFSKEGELLGSKSTLEQLVHEITGIPIAALRGTPLTRFSVDERLEWAAKRATKKKEDQAYCLLGIFRVFLPLIYGEGDHAFVRLKEEINKSLRGISTVLHAAYSPRMANLTRRGNRHERRERQHALDGASLVQHLVHWKGGHPRGSGENCSRRGAGRLASQSMSHSHFGSGWPGQERDLLTARAACPVPVRLASSFMLSCG